ncbi:MAG: VOC family protein [Gaiellaceae bacterium]
MRLNGIHHITCVTADARRNLDFYTQVLGLRLVKKTVNQDDPSIYHLFYADEAGSPGADITFFEFPGAPPGAAGAGMVHTIVSRVASERALEFWAERLASSGVDVTNTKDRLDFRDPEGLHHEFAVARVDDEPLAAQHPDIDAAFALQGFDGVRAYAEDPTHGSHFLSGALGFEGSVESSAWRVDGPTRSAFYARDMPPDTSARPGPGTVHHVAFSTALEEQARWHDLLRSAGANPSPVIDRFWFRSIYFREPSGVLFELATEGPGFTTDEPLERLGEKLTLPPQLEPMRERIEATLTPLPNQRR